MDFPVLFNNMCVSRQDCGRAGDRIGNWVTANYDGSSLTWKNLSSRHFQYKGSQVEKYLHIVSSFLKKVEISNIVEKYGSEWSKMHEKTQELSLHNVTPPQSVPNTSLMKSCQKYENLFVGCMDFQFFECCSTSKYTTCLWSQKMKPWILKFTDSRILSAA